MNIIEAISKRTSVREFTGESISKNNLEKMFELANTAPSHVNGQQISLVYTIDKEKIKKIAELCGGQEQVRTAEAFILLVGDYTRHKILLEKENLNLTDDEKHLREIAYLDAGLIAMILNLSAREFSYGCTMIGGVQNNPKEIAKLFNLPENVFIILGLTVGIPKKPNAVPKPKISKKAFVMEDEYNLEIQEKAIIEYEETLDKWFKSINVKQPLFREVIKRFFKKK